MSASARIGPYELLGRLGAGGMAETYLAKKTGPARFEQRVCLKRMLPELAEDAELTQLFLQEAQLAATLRHGNIAQVLDFGEADGNYYLVLELVEGSDLRFLLHGLRAADETMTSGLVAHLGLAVAAGLQRAHDEGIVHRDISPSNILLSTSGEVKVADFGVARRVLADRTRTASVKGKVPYMAPEYAREGSVHPGIDLFSLGVTLFEALTGQRPFDGRNDLQTLENIALGKRPGILELVPTTPPELAHAIESLLEPDPDVRIGTTRELRQRLSVVAPPPTARRILKKLVRAHARPAPDADLELDDTQFQETQAATPGGTMQVGARPEREKQPVSAPADAETRTRMPDPAHRTDVVEPPTAQETRTTFDPLSDPAGARADVAPEQQNKGRAVVALGVAVAVFALAAIAWLLSR